MNFNFNNQRTKLQFSPPIMRSFSTIGLVATKPESDFILKPDYIFKNVPNSLFNTFNANMSSKSFSNPNFVNKQNPNVLSTSVIKFTDTNKEFENINPSKSENNKQSCSTSQNLQISAIPTEPEITEIKSESKKIKNRNRKNRKNSKRRKQESNETTIDQKQQSPKKSLKKFKKSPKSKNCKSWHKYPEEEYMDCDESILIPSPPSEAICLRIQSSPIEITAKCSSLSFSISPCSTFIKNFSSSSSSDVLSISPSSPALRRFQLPSECDSEDSFVVFCDDITNDCQDVSSQDEEDSDDSDCDSDGNTVLDTPKKKVTFKQESELCEVHPMIQWNFAYQSARKGPWEQIARDRARFESRILKMATILAPILNTQHRERIFKDRFERFN